MNRKLFIIVCNLIACICFGIVSYGQLYHGKTGLGILFACLSFSQGCLLFLNKRQEKNHE